MALVVGDKSSVSCTLFGGAKLTAATININTGMNDVSGFGDNGQTDSEATILGYSGTASGILDDTSQAGAAVTDSTFVQGNAQATLTITEVTGKTWSGTATLSNISINIVYAQGQHSTVSFDWASTPGFVSST